MLGYNAFGYKLLALTVSGTLSGISGAAYALLFAYVGSTFASTQLDLSLLWVLLGGAGTPVGPLIGTAMFYLVEFSSGITSSYMIAVGIILVCSSSHSPRYRRHRPSRLERGAAVILLRTRRSSFGSVQAVKDVDLSLPRARSARSSARTAPARPPLPA